MPRRPVLPLLLTLLLPAWLLAVEPPVAGRDDVARLIAELGAKEYDVREAATRALIGRGEGLAETLRAERIAAEDPEIRHRLQYVLTNITPPQFAVLVVSADRDAGLRPGDVITHVNGRLVRSTRDLRQRIGSAEFGLMLRIRRPDGTRELGPLEPRALYEVTDFVAPRGQSCARILRLFDEGLAEQAADALRELEQNGSIREDELPGAVRACLLFTVGLSTPARNLLRGAEDLALPINMNRPWDSPSGLDRVLGRKAPFQLEWLLFTEGGPTFQRTSIDHDLRMQRLLEPAGRYLETAVRALQIWYSDLRDGLGADRMQEHVAGNMLAVAGWMLYDLGLRSECCRLIEPRSILLRRGNNGNPQKWVRVDTDAWLPYLAGDTKAAVDSFYDYALAVLADPPHPDEERFVIQNPLVAARIAFFLYQLPDDRRIDELGAQVIRDKHPILTEYLDWMLAALRFENQKIVRRDLHAALPLLDCPACAVTARDVALLEYVQEEPRREILQAALDTISAAQQADDRAVWVAIVTALERLAADAPDEAVRVLEPFAGHALVRALHATARFKAEPPPESRMHDVLRDPLLAVPAGDATWYVLTRQRRLVVFDVPAETVTPLPTPIDDWFPNPRTWPWIGVQPGGNRAWVYAPRRMIEMRPDATYGVRLNLRSEQIPAIESLVGPVFDDLARLVDDPSAAPAPRSGEFLAEDVRANASMVSDPRLPEIAMVGPLRRDPRLAQVVLRGGQQLLLVPEAGRAYGSGWFARQLDAPDLRFFAQAEQADGAGGPRAWLFSDRGLLHFDCDTEVVERLALPGDAPHPAVIPESIPYVRRDPRYLYCARLPDEGGQVCRVRLADRVVEPLDLVNLALPPEYFQTLSRAEIRDRLDEFLQAELLPPLGEIIEEADLLIRALAAERTE